MKCGADARTWLGSYAIKKRTAWGGSFFVLFSVTGADRDDAVRAAAEVAGAAGGGHTFHAAEAADSRLKAENCSGMNSWITSKC